MTQLQRSRWTRERYRLIVGAVQGEVPEFHFEVLVGEASGAVVEELVALVQSAYRGEESRRGWTTEADLLEGQRVDAPMLNELLRRSDALILTARSTVPGDSSTKSGRGALIGCCELRRQDGDSAYLGMFAVAPGLQGAGVGKAFLSEAERVARDRWGANRLAITVIDARTELIAWYERHGFARTGSTEPFPYGDERFGVPLRPDLEFVALQKKIDGQLGA